MNVLGALTRFYAYSFHVVLSLFLLTIAILARASHQSLRFEMIPFGGDDAVAQISIVGLTGLVCVVLAAAGIFEFVFPLWALAVTVLLIWGYWFTPYMFSGTREALLSVALIAASALAFWGAFLVLLPRRGRITTWD